MIERDDKDLPIAKEDYSLDEQMELANNVRTLWLEALEHSQWVHKLYDEIENYDDNSTYVDIEGNLESICKMQNAIIEKQTQRIVCLFEMLANLGEVRFNKSAFISNEQLLYMPDILNRKDDEDE